MKWLRDIRQVLISKFLLVIAQYWQQFGEVRVAMFVPGHSGSNHPHLSTSCQGNDRNIIVLLISLCEDDVNIESQLVHSSPLQQLLCQTPSQTWDKPEREF